MGIIKEYVDRAVQTDVDTVPSPYTDPAVVLAAPPVTRCGVARESHSGHHNSVSVSSTTGSGSICAVPQSPTSPMLASLVSRRLSRHRHARCPTGEIMNRRIVSMPENNVLSYSHSKRVVSMPERVRSALEPSAELFQSPSTTAGDSFVSYSGRHERVRGLRAPSDVPQTPSPPSSPESLLIIAAGAQLPEGFLRRKYSPEPLIEEDWITWANSPPRPIPALHGPLSLPYARCPSGAEGTIIEEPDNVAQMIWGLGPDDQSHNQGRSEGISPHPDNPQNAPSQGLGQIPPRLQKRTSATQQPPKSSRTQISHTSHAKQSLARSQCQAHDDKHGPLSQVSSSIDTRQDIANGLPWDESQPMPINVGVPDDFVNDADVFLVDNNRLLEWQLTRFRRALKTSLGDVDSYATYAGRLEPVIPAAVAPGLPQPYPRIFVEPRHNESVTSSTRQSSIELAQQHRQQRHGQALQKQKLQIQDLPTPPNSSSPQWSSHFSPHLTYCSTLSPDLVGSIEQVPVSSQKYRPSPNASQYIRHVYGRHEYDDVDDFNTKTNVPSAKTPQIMPNANSAPPLRQSSSSSSTLAKYIKQLQVLSPIARLPPLQPVPPPNVSLPTLPSTDEGTVPFRTAYHSPIISTPPSPESPQISSRGPYRSARSIVSSCPMQWRLSSVPEEGNAVLEFPTSISPSRLQSQVTTDNISSSYERTAGHQIRYADMLRESTIPEFESNVGTPSIAFQHETSPVKVRLPVTKGHNIREQTSGYHEQNKERQHGHKKKHRYKKLKGPAAANEQVQRVDL